jgi:hypothetical protein
MKPTLTLLTALLLAPLEDVEFFAEDERRGIER